MKSMRFARLLITMVAAALCFAGAANAAPSQAWAASWTAPTTRVDGTALSASELTKYTLSYTVDGGAAQSVEITGGATASKSITTNLAARTTPYVLVFSMTATDTDGNTSEPSAAITKSIRVKTASPNKPGGFKIDVQCTNGSCNLIIL
jgi:hypothetical protein